MSTRRRIEFELVGNAGSIEAVLNRLNSGITRTGYGARGLNRDLGMVEKQLMAIGTTARYALAGSLVFGITGAISKLAQFESQLGTVASLAGSLDSRSGRYTAPGDSFIERVGDQAVLTSNKLGIAVDDIQNYMTRFFSAFDLDRMGGRQKLAALGQFVDEVGRLQAMLGPEAGDPQQLAGGIAGLVRQIPGGGRNIGKTTNRVANLVSLMLATTPNITGRDVARDIGRVGATMQIANMSPEQAFAVWSIAGRAGGSSSVIGRGVSQLLGTSLLNPSTPAQMKAFSQAGLPTDPTTLRNMGGMRVLSQMLRAVAPRGARVRNPAALNDENLDDTTGIAASGTKGINLTLLYNLLGRQESVRQFIALIAQGGVPALQQQIKLQEKANKNNAVREREEAAIRRRALLAAGMSAANLPLTLMRGFRWPLEHLAAPPIIATSNAATRHPGITHAAEYTIGAALGVAGARKLIGRFKRGGIGGAASGAAGAAIAAEEMSSLVGGGATDGTRAKPYWVMISPASWMVGTPGGFGSPVPGTPGSSSSLMKKLFGGGVAGAKSLGFKGLGVAGAALAIPESWNWLMGQFQGNTRAIPKGHPLLSRFSDNQFAGGLNPGRMPSGAEQSVLNQFANNMIGTPRAEALLRLLESRRGAGVAGAQFSRTEGSMDVTVRLVDSQGRTIGVQKKGGVPVKMWPATGTPTAQGKSGTRKSGK